MKKRVSLVERVESSSNGIPIKYNDPLEFYHKNCEGLTRGQIARRRHGLYERMRTEGLLRHVPTADLSLAAKLRSPYGANAEEYYHKNCEGIPRGRLSIEHPSLYFRLRREGKLDIVPFKYPKKS